jgi:sensor histidine kinase YesM
MQASPFIFSEERKWRLRRHIAFWMSWGVFAGFIYSIGPIATREPYLRTLTRSMADSFAYLPLHMFCAYSLMYFLIPRYLVKGKYVMSVLSAVVIFIITALLSVISNATVIEWIHNWYGQPPIPKDIKILRTIQYGLMAGLRGGITIGGLAAAIKLLKYYYVKEQRNLQLQKEKAEAQLQLLKAQVHPHFLFNTLNNIYSHTQGKAPVASQLVMGLSEMLRFMLYEGNQSLVPLSKELKMVQDYISLEKIRYDDHLDVHIDVPADTDNLHITPMLLLPLVENCFKHGTSNMLEQPWLSLHIRIEDSTMHMKLINGKPVETGKQRDAHEGIGIKNVRARLELLYPGRHTFTITDDPEVFVVNLQLQLDRKAIAKKKESSSFVLTNHD